MKKVLIFIILISCCHIYGQKPEFNKLLSKFGQIDNELDSVIIKKYFDIDLHPDYAPYGHADKIIFRKNHIIGLSCNVQCAAGGICEYAKFRIFDYQGNVIDEIDRFEFIISDCYDSSERYCAYDSDSIIILVDVNTELDCDTDTLLKLDVTIATYRIDTNGKISELNKHHIDTKREYFITSIKLLTDSELINKTKHELATMRNEIFAAHGYIFKTEKWSNFFNTKSWYNPRSNNVDEYLTIIERENIKKIKKHESL